MRYIVPLIFFTSLAYAQPNCNVYKLKGDSLCYQACLVITSENSPQGARTSQESFDKAIELCPSFDYAYFEKSVPYLKRGDFVTWKKLIDQAVALNPTAHLGYRGWCRYQFIRDYEGAIKDFETLSAYLPDIGYSQNGDYHLSMVRGLCYKAIGQKAKAITIMESQLKMESYSPMPYDFLHLGVVHMENGNSAVALEYLQKSIVLNDYLADPYYYMGKIYLSQGDKDRAREQLQKAKVYYEKGYKRFDPYTHPIDKVYLSDIEDLLADLQ
jgi:tetratricopeptide (TPR) repeat protein